MKTTQKPSPALRALARQLLVSSDPALVVETLRAGTVLRIGFELLRDMRLPRGDRPLRDAECAADLAAFRPGDRLQVPDEAGEVATDLADVASDLRLSLFDLVRRESDGFLRLLTNSHFREWGIRDVLFALERLPPASIEQLRSAARNAPPPARPRPPGGRNFLVSLERRRRNQAAALRRLAEALDHDADRINEQLDGPGDSTRRAER